MAEPKRVVVIGIGEILAGDYGVGKRAVRLLKQQFSSAGDICFLEAGTAGVDLESIIAESRYLIVLDATDTGKPPGTLMEFICNDGSIFRDFGLLPHQYEFYQVLQRVCMKSGFPERIRLIGIQPAGLSLGFELSSEVSDSIPVLVECAASLIKSWQSDSVTVDSQSPDVLTAQE